MQSFTWHSSVYALVVILGFTTVSCVTQGRNPKFVSPDSQPFTATEPEATTKATVQTAYGKLPLSFEANQGQSDAQVKFLSHSKGYSISLAPTEAVITLRPLTRNGESENRRAGEKRKEEGGNLRSVPPNPSATVLRLQLVGANPDATVSGVDELPGRVNYISGQDQTKWHTSIPTYAKVKYENVYPGVDLLYYGNDQRRLEYDFQVAPGADPTRIRMKFAGVDSLNMNDIGELVVHAAGRELRQHAPQMYQEVAGVRQRISGGYVITGSHEVGLALGKYDTSRPLIIDPVITYSTYAGSVNSDAFTGDHDSGNDIAVDAAGNIYVVATANAVNRYDTDVLVRKFNPSGSTLLYATYLDSNNSNDLGNGIAVDSAGNAYVTGQFGDPMLPGWALGVLVAKLSSAGVPVYSGTFGADSPGYRQDEGMSIAVDDAGHAYIVGTTYRHGSAFPTTAGAFQRSTVGGRLTDAFVVKVNPSGTDFIYSTLLGGTGDEEGLGIAIRKVGSVYNAYVTGRTSPAGFGVPGDFPTTAGAFQRTFGGAEDVFVTQLNDTGSALVYSTYIGGNGNDGGDDIAVDAAGNAYLTGFTSKEPLDSISRFPIVNAFQPIYGGQGGATPAAANAFVLKLNPTGSGLIYSSYMGGGNGHELYDEGTAITVDAAGNAYLTGVTGTRTDIFTGSHFPILNAFQQTPGGGTSSPYNDAFVAKVSPEGALIYSSYLGGNYEDEGHGIAVDGTGNVYLTGATMSADFPTTAGAYQRQIAGGGCSYPFSCPDAFVTKISSGNSMALSVTKAGTGSGTVTSSPAGISCGTDCSQSYASGTVVTLTAAPAAGSIFAGWSGSCTGTGTCSVSMSAAKSVTATFTITQTMAYKLTITKSGAGVGTVVSSSPAGITCGTTCAASYPSGRAVVLIAAPTTGSTFGGWSGDADCVDGSVTMTANKTCTARFNPAVASADLFVSALSGPSASAAGATVTVTETTKNQGSGAAGASTTKFYLSTDTTFGTSDVLLGSRAVPALAAGASNAAATALHVPANIAVGSYYILARADANGVVPETNETNNTNAKALGLGPDLVVSALAAPASGGAGTTITVTATAKNQGGSGTGASTIKVYLSTDSTLGTSDVLLGSRAVPALAAGASNAASTSVTIPLRTARGNYFLLAVSDANKVVKEAQEGNNVKSKAFTIP